MSEVCFIVHIMSMSYWQIGIVSVYHCKDPGFESSC